MKKLLKRSMQAGVSLVAPAIWRCRAPALLVLMYHRVLPPEHPDRAVEQPGMFVSPSTLEMHLELLRDLFEFIHIDEWIERLANGRPLPKHACAVTFDDGWRDNYTFAYPILKRKGVPATIYLVSDLVGTTYDFWPNVIANVIYEREQSGQRNYPDWLAQLVGESKAVSESSLNISDRVIGDLKAKKTDAEMQVLVEELRASLSKGGSERNLMSWQEIRELSGAGLVRFGSHTRTHTRLLPQVDSERLREEVVGPVGVIQEQLGYRPRSFCYPNGDYSPAALSVVRSAYQGAVTTKPGWNNPGSDRYLLRRVGLHEDVSCTESSFLSRITGFG